LTTSSVSQVDQQTGAVPVIDIGPFFAGGPEERAQVAADVGRACEEIGFLVVVGHGVPDDAIEAMYDVSKRFYDLPAEAKLPLVSPSGDAFQGYCPIGESSRYDPGAPPSLLEMYHVNRHDTPDEAMRYGYSKEVLTSLQPNIWPSEPPDFQAVWRRYFTEMDLLANRLLSVFAVALDLPEDWFADKVDHSLANLAANNYPEQPTAPLPGQFRSKAHVDFSTLTILYQDGAPGGLQVHQRNSGWRDVPFLAGSYVVNLGDLMARWTNDRWVATPHRVVNPPAELAMTRRISLPFFHHPNPDAVIEAIPTCVSADRPPKYEPVVASEWIEARRTGRPANHGRIAV
jgi:isopenicillin N synthase-like dioxygenase